MTKKTTEIATKPAETGITFSTEQTALIANTIAKGADQNELALFIGMCKRTRLDPFSRQIYFIKANGRVMTQISIDGFRVIAERSGQYAGQDAPIFVEKNGKLESCSVSVYRWHGSERFQAAVGVAYMAEYARGGNWNQMPHTMLSKVAECIALRKAFPNDLSGLYAPEEMEQANVPTAPIKGEVIEQATDKILCQRCLKNLKTTEILPEQAKATFVELGYALCDECSEIGRAAKQAKPITNPDAQPPAKNEPAPNDPIMKALEGKPEELAKPLTQMARIKVYEAEINACENDEALATVAVKLQDDFELSTAASRTVEGFLKQRAESIKSMNAPE